MNASSLFGGNRLSTRQMIAFVGVSLFIAVAISWFSYQSARDALREASRERGRTALTALEAEAAEKLAEGDREFFGKYFDDLLWRDPGVLYISAIDASKIVLADSQGKSVGKPWTMPEGTPWGSMKIVERFLPFNRKIAHDLTIPLSGEEKGSTVGYLQIGIDYTHASQSLDDLAKRAALIGLAIMVVAIFVARIVSRQITSGLARLAGTAERISAGDIEATASEEGFEEIRALARAFNSMTGHLRSMLGRVGDGSVRLSGVAADVGDVLRDQAQVTTQQAASVAEITATMEELARTSRQIADNSEDVRGAASTSVDVARQGTHLGRQGLESTARIRDRVLDISRKTVYLNEKSGEIGKVLAIIKEIASEIHLLALNAAIESAAAGEHGRRFAVVASEVRRLADKTRESAETIRLIVSEIQVAAKSTAEVSEQGAREVESWKESAEEISASFEKIIRQIETTSDASERISLATHQQTSANEQVVQSMRQVADLVRGSANRMKGLSASADILTGLADDLKGQASEFRKT